MPALLHRAVIAGDMESARSVLASGCNVNETDTSGSTALHWAVRHGRKDIVVALLEANAQVMRQNKHKLTPIDMAKKWGHNDMLPILRQNVQAGGGSGNGGGRGSRSASQGGLQPISRRITTRSLGPATTALPSIGSGSEQPSSGAVRSASSRSSRRHSRRESDSEFEHATNSAMGSQYSGDSFSGSDFGTSDSDMDDDWSSSSDSEDVAKVHTLDPNATVQLSKEDKIKAHMARAIKRQKQRIEEEGQLVIFLSSPFNGLRDERDIFINRYLPLLRSQAEEQGIHVKVVDLRWGISSKQSEEGMTLTICLTGVKESHLFIGFYGARYGTVYNPAVSWTHWVKRDFDKAQDKFPWILKFTTRAVTELEFRSGWLNTPGTRPAAFYFRDPVYDESMAKALDDDPDEAKRSEARHYRNPFESDVVKLQALKDECHEEALTFTYYEPSEAAKMFHEQCNDWLAEVLPSGGLTAMAVEDGAHRAFGKARTTMYVSDAPQVTDFCEAVRSATSKRVILLEGPSGAGKSALLANFIVQYQKQHSDHVMITHHIGCTSESTNLGHTLRRLIYHLLRDKKVVEGDAALAIEKSLPDVTEINELTRLFHSSILKRCDKLKKRGNLLVITIDALTQLDKFTYRDDIGDVTEAHALQWMLPEARMPDNVRIVLASLKGRPVDVLSRRGDVEFRHTLPLSKNDRNKFCEAVLEKASKTLKPNQLRRVVYGESYLIPKKLVGKAKKGGSVSSVYLVQDAGSYRVHGKYVEHPTELSDGQPVYVKTDDARFRLERKEGVWCLGHYYRCPHGTDSPPAIGWVSTDEAYNNPPIVRCLQPPTQLPLYLKLAMEELVAFGVYEMLDEKIREIASCGSIPTLLLLMLDRIEDGQENKGAVRSVFSQIWCSRNGMMSAELCELCGIESETSLEWSLLFTAVKPFLVSRGGRYTFLHNYIKQAVEARYCPTTGHRWAVASIQFYYFYPYLKDPAAPKERKLRADEELSNLTRFVESKVLQAPQLEAHTEELDFTGNKVGSEVAKAIGQGLSSNKTLVRLSIGGNAIADKGCEAITKALHMNNTLVHLDLSGNGITNDGAKSIGSALAMNKCVSYLNLSDNKISVNGAKAIGRGIIANSSITYLNCSRNSFGPEGAKGVARALRENLAIEQFYLEENAIGDDGATEMGAAMQSNRSIQELFLGRNGIGDAGCFALFDACKLNPVVVKLDLADNAMSIKGAEGTNELLLNCSTLVTLNIQGNTLGNDGVMALAPALQRNTTLRSLNLNGNNIGDAGARALGEALSKNSALITLYLAGNQIGDSGMQGLSKALHCANSQSMQKFYKLWKYETGYLKQWKNRNQLKGGALQSESDVLGADAKDSKDPTKGARNVISLEQLSKLLEKEAKVNARNNRQSVNLGRTSAAKDVEVPDESIAGAPDQNGGGDGGGEKESVDSADSGAEGKRKKKWSGLPGGGGGGAGSANSRTSGIKELHLNNNVFGPEGAHAIGQALSSNSTLEELILFNNSITDNGAEKIFEALKVNTSLVHLHMANTGVMDQSLKVLGEALASNQSLVRVDFTDNYITNDGMKGFASGLAQCTKSPFASINLTGNTSISDKGARDVGMAMLENHLLTLTELLLPTSVHADLNNVLQDLCAINKLANPQKREAEKKRRDHNKAPLSHFKARLKRRHDVTPHDVAAMLECAPPADGVPAALTDHVATGNAHDGVAAGDGGETGEGDGRRGRLRRTLSVSTTAAANSQASSLAQRTSVVT